MKKTTRFAHLFIASALFLGLTSCSSSNDDPVVPNSAPVMSGIVENYVDNVVNPTYKSLAANAQVLYTACQNLNAKAKAGTLTQADIDAACDAFKAARKDWEQSEAFLYGAATENGIDPHIDSWPLDHSQLQDALTNKDIIAGINGANPAKFVYDNNGNFESVLGFHGLEFILFRDGKNRTLAAINAGNETEEGLTSVKTADELAFAAAVAGDLRNMIFLLEYGWLGSNIEASHDAVLKAAPWVLSGTLYKNGLSKPNVSYGDYLRTAGTATGMFATWQETLQNVFIGGCSHIAQEVFEQKLGQAYRTATGTATGDDAGDYIESPYSKRSFIDYQDNIFSIKNSLYGVRNQNAPVAKSILTYLKAKNYPNYDKLTTALNEAIQALETAKNSGIAFIDDPKHAQVKNCIDKVEALDNALNEAGKWIATQPTE